MVGLPKTTRCGTERKAHGRDASKGGHILEQAFGTQAVKSFARFPRTHDGFSESGKSHGDELANRAIRLRTENRPDLEETLRVSMDG